MGDKSGIQWTDATWNPVTGCSKVSPGCANCYAETVALRFWGKQYPPVIDNWQTGESHPRKFTDVWCHDDRLDQPLRWRRPRKIFVNSMSDLFHEDVPDEFIASVFNAMSRAQHHTFQVLTKRAKRLHTYASSHYFRALPNVWLGVSVENQHFANERIPLLLDTPAAVRFISYEPAIGGVDLGGWLGCFHETGTQQDDHSQCAPRLDWVIVGGESGKDSRPFNINWARRVVEQCAAAGTACFVKQLGRVPYEAPEGVTPYTAGERAIECQMVELDIDPGHGGDWVEWPEDLRVRQFPKVA